LYERGSVAEQSFAPQTASSNGVGRVAPSLDVKDGPQRAAQHLRACQRGYQRARRGGVAALRGRVLREVAARSVAPGRRWAR
jgi:hypothetical protein